MVQHNTQVASIIELVSPGLVDRGNGSVGIGDVNFADCLGGLATDKDRGILDLYICPAFEGEACVGRKTRIIANEVGKSAFGSRAEGLGLDGQCGLEQDGSQNIAVGSLDHGFGRGLRLLDATLLVIGRNLNQSLTPCDLGGFDLRLRD